MPSASPIQDRLNALDATDDTYAVRIVDLILDGAAEYHATDIHLRPTAAGLEWSWRLDGALHEVAILPCAVMPNVIARLKVLADLLTYRTDVPQEGRILRGSAGAEMRLSTFPTLHGEKAVIRVFSQAHTFQYLDDLGFPIDVTQTLRALLRETSGAIVVTGPAGSGKTTTLYSCLREIAQQQPVRNRATLEDPIEVEVAGVAQSQVHTDGKFDLATALKYLLRQDPEVIMISEVRDRTVAESVIQAALTGHLVLTTFHAGSAVAAVNRFSDMGIEPYLLRSGLSAILSQRLVRRLCECRQETSDDSARLGLPVEKVCVPVGCEACYQTGYRGRMALVELLTFESHALSRAVLAREDSRTLAHLADQSGFVSLWTRAVQAVTAGTTSPAEVRRVFGFSEQLGTAPI